MPFRPGRSAMVLLLTIACSRDAPEGPAQKSPTPRALQNAVVVETVASGLVHPWGFAFLPDARILVTERGGTLRLVGIDGKVSTPLTGVPTVYARGQGGLLDVAVDPRFATNHLVYLSYSEPSSTARIDDASSAGTSVARARLSDSGIVDVRVIYAQEPKVMGGNHFGSRIAFKPDGTLFITQGERYTHRDEAQDLSTDFGKVVRINTDGTIPRDNPLVGQPDVRPEIWSYGHRNVQAAAVHPETGQLWTVEHGAMGGDELNHPEAGKNYGWPVITYGRDYNGRRIGRGAVRQGMEQPVYYWDPVIAPSGMIVYTGSAFRDWKDNILIGGLASNALVRLVMQNGKVTREERYLGELHERIRDVQQGPDGLIYVITDSPQGRVLRLKPGVPR